jgi:hypothetical protein
MDNPAALHRIQVGVPATVEHSSEAGPETGKWVAETTQVCLLNLLYIVIPMRALPEFHHFHGRPEAPHESERPITSYSPGTCDWICTIQRKQRLGR